MEKLFLVQFFSFVINIFLNLTLELTLTPSKTLTPLIGSIKTIFVDANADAVIVLFC